MRKNWMLGLIACVITLLAACTPPTEEALPTLIATIVPPTSTPAPQVAPSTETSTPDYTPTLVLDLQLPPTWTPTFTASPIPPTVTPTELPTVLQNTLPPTCNTFGPDYNNSDSTFPLGTSPHVSWVLADGTRYYRVWVTDENDTELFVDYVAETEINFPADIFESGHRYAWNVYPVDQYGVQMCYTRGAELDPVSQP